MNIEKIKVNGHYVWVDEVVGWSYNGLCYNDDGTIGKPINSNSKKIIASSYELNLEGVPTYVEFLSNEHDKTYFDYDETNTQPNYDFISGYKAAEKDLFTEDDVKEAIEIARIYHIDSVTTFDIIQQIKESKTK